MSRVAETLIESGVIERPPVPRTDAELLADAIVALHRLVLQIRGKRSE